jgi:heptose I phosphotransferase
MPGPPEPDASRVPPGLPAGWIVRDAGRLWLAESFARVLESPTFAALFDLAGGSDVRVIGQRRTTRFELPGGEVYLKRFGRLSWGERIKNWVRLRQPDHGAEGEFRAILGLTSLGISTVVPLAFGQHNGCSLLVTEGLTGYRDLKSLLQTHDPLVRDPVRRRRIVEWLADLTRTMHGAGYHHQDLYLNHVLVGPRVSAGGGDTLDVDLRLIDLGRVRCRKPLGRRWVLKDLAQLHYSSARGSRTERLRFYVRYLGRSLNTMDRRFIRAIAAKSAAIDRHTRRHGL